jgi:hypothetical protein
MTRNRAAAPAALSSVAHPLRAAVGLALVAAAVHAQSAVVLHRSTADNSEFSQTWIDDPLLNGNDFGTYPLAVGYSNAPGGTAQGADDFDVFYNGIENRWAIGLRSVDMPIGATYIVWIPRPTSIQLPAMGATIRYLNSAADTSGAVTTFDSPLLNGHPERSVKLIWGGGGFLLANQPVAFYDGGAARWKAKTSDGSNMPFPVYFHVCVERCGLGGDPASVHLATVDCAAPVGARCDAFSAEARSFLPLYTSLTTGVDNDHPPAAYRDDAAPGWRVENDDGGAMNAGAEFFAAFSNLIFESGFETGNTLGFTAVP